MSVLAHLVTSMGWGEPEATQALAYIFRQQPGILRAFVSLLGAAGVTFNPGRIEFDDNEVYLPGNDKYLPIRLKPGVEREKVVEDAVEQIRAAVFGG